ncbi:MAG: tRNA (adenosine(37)-N6)-threonylcarbamoyltransferase complex transferase subunit TsaD [Candidatus Cloacimonetes bacterium 4572_55]|nr:MAG: tRNA (adenosine(37)-N6)-threonylcarbamoyltransferase complex transferase subunit TsaD [Candidatus Cloacimonetes bacterium 4572_55]
MVILGIESSCDETAAAVVVAGQDIRSNIIASQSEHIRYGGVVPELAARAHTRLILPIIQEALDKAGTTLDQIDGIAVTKGPGLIGSLLVGISTAKAIAMARNKPLIGVHHLEGHIFANFLAHPELQPPFICLLVSGGHSELILVRELGKYQILGRTRDDAAGEAFDKVAKMLGLPYPGGPSIEKAAKNGDVNFVKFPVARIKNGRYDFSFSGLKTAALNYLRNHKEEVDSRLADICAGFQEAIVRALTEKTLLAARDFDTVRIVLAGGVASNQRLRKQMSRLADAESLQVYYPPPVLCTDNAAMIAGAGYHYLRQGIRSDLKLNGYPSLRLD